MKKRWIILVPAFNAETPRRGTRLRKPTSKALENKYVKTLARSGFVGNISSSEEYSSDNDEFNVDNEPKTPSGSFKIIY